MIRDVRVWDTALTPSQVLGLYDQAPPPPPEPQVDVTFEGAATARPAGEAGSFTGLPIGTPRDGRLVVAAVAMDRQPSLGRKIASATVNGTPVAFTNPSDGNSVGFVHAVVPTRHHDQPQPDPHR